MRYEWTLTWLAHGRSGKRMRYEWTLTWLAHGCSAKWTKCEWTLTRFDHACSEMDEVLLDLNMVGPRMLWEMHEV